MSRIAGAAAPPHCPQSRQVLPAWWTKNAAASGSKVHAQVCQALSGCERRVPPPADPIRCALGALQPGGAAAGPHPCLPELCWWAIAGRARATRCQRAVAAALRNASTRTWRAGPARAGSRPRSPATVVSVQTGPANLNGKKRLRRGWMIAAIEVTVARRKSPSFGPSPFEFRCLEFGGAGSKGGRGRAAAI